jgi:hypothetical protein
MRTDDPMEWDMKPLAAAFILLGLTASLTAESRPRDGSQPADPPRFCVGWQVQWSDGSIGRIVEHAQWRPSDLAGEWYYPVQFGGPDSPCWSLPEQGLELAEQ